MNQQTQSKGGWIASFIIIGAVLVLALLTGLYYLKSRQIEGSAPQPIATETEHPEKNEAPEAKAPSSDTKKDAEDKTEKKDEKKQQAPATDSAPATNQPNNEETPATTTDEEEKDTESAPSGTLPETGPADMGAQLIAVVALSISSVAYVQSRRGL